MKESRKTYRKEFKQKAVELSNVRGNVHQIARELDILPELICLWRREFSNRPDLAFSGHGKKHLTEEQKELARLMRALEDMTMERDILKKAVRIFSVSDRKSVNS